MKKILFILFLSAVSFSSLAQQLYAVNAVNGGSCGISKGSVFTASGLSGACVGSTKNPYNLEVSRIKLPSNGNGWVTITLDYNGSDFSYTNGLSINKASSCPSGKILNSSGVCVEIPTCEVGQVWDEQTQSCELAPDTEGFCGSSEFVEIHAAEGNACAAQYPGFLTDLNFTCDNRQNYSFTCNQGIEKPTDPDPTDPDPTDPDPTDPDPTDPDPTDPDPTDPDPTDPDPTDPDPTDPDPTDPDPTDPDPTNPDPTYNNSGNATGSGSSGGSATASEGNVSVDISFDGVHNRLDAVNENLAGTNERIETTNDILNDFSNRYNQNSDRTNNSLDLIGEKLDKNGKQLTDSIGGLGEKLDDISDGSNTVVNGGSCEANSFTCDGNAYECFIARKAWKNDCLMESLTGDPVVPQEGVPLDAMGDVYESGDELIEDLKNYSNGVDTDDLSNGEVVISDALNEFDESNGLSFDEKCPAPHVVDTGMGVMTIDYTPFCDLALYVRAMLMLFASIGSILMISKFS